MIGFPILDDDLYNRTVDIYTKKHNRCEIPQQIYLHASRLSLKHPGNRTPLEIDAPAPAEFLQKIRDLSLVEDY